MPQAPRFRTGHVLFVTMVILCSTLDAAAQRNRRATLVRADAVPAATNSSPEAVGATTVFPPSEVSPGFFDIRLDRAMGRLYLRVDKLDTEFLYVNGLTAGVGSNDIGLDRGQLGDTRIVRFERRGNRILMIEPNYRYRAVSDNPLEARSVREAFATSVLWGFEIVEGADGVPVIELTDFLLRDAHDVSGRLRSAGQGSYAVDKSRSALYEEGVFNFPNNTEMEALITLTGSGAGAYLRSVVPTPDAVTVRMHHSFIALPDDGYVPRAFDVRAGYYGTRFQDYASPIDAPLTTQFIARHRLKKQDPAAERSEAVEPIVYYLDNGTPEPIRSALLEGARWWNEAFEAAGYIDAFRVEILPEDAHPLDVRYNVIQWVHRSTRGWSYGSSVVDPRTGEIIKGHVSLGSLRVRQDYLIFKGLAPELLEQGESAALVSRALARIRQLSAHEVGHTLGIMHNFAASTQQDASVMDYPHPQHVSDEAGGYRLPETPYDTGIGEWDKLAVAYGYQDFPEGTDEASALDALLREGYAGGLRYISDADARATSGAHPFAHLWDYGMDPVAQLEQILAIRREALSNFGESAIPVGRPMAELEEVLVPLYFYHRYQVEATVKVVGGIDYRYSNRGDGSPPPRAVPIRTQNAALRLLMQTLDAEQIALPKGILGLIPPRAAGMPSSRETMGGRMGPILDPVAMAGTSASVTLGLLLNPDRMNRLMLYASLRQSPSVREVFDRLMSATWYRGSHEDAYLNLIQRHINLEMLRHTLVLADAERAHAGVRSIALETIARIADVASDGDIPEAALVLRYIEQFHAATGAVNIPAPPDAPPGSPIGSFDQHP